MASGSFRSYRDLIAWQKAMALCKRVYGLTEAFPKSEMYCLTQQLRRATISVPSNIAEGWGRGVGADYIRFLRTARGSLYEVETQVHLAKELHYTTDPQTQDILGLCDECSRVLQGLIASLERNHN